MLRMVYAVARTLGMSVRTLGETMDLAELRNWFALMRIESEDADGTGPYKPPPQQSLADLAAKAAVWAGA